MIKWAGWLIVFLGAGHLVGGLALSAPEHADAWFDGTLWRSEEAVAEMGPVMGTFWLTTGSFAVPLVLTGVLLLWLDGRGIVPPAFVAWTLALWAAVAAAIFEPAPWLLAWIAAGLLLAGARRAARPAGRPTAG